MKKILPLIVLASMTTALICSCDSSQKQANNTSSEWIVDRFDDIRVLKYKVDGFENLPLDNKILIYYLSQSALSGRDIIWDQNFKYNLLVRRTLEAMYESYAGKHEGKEWDAFEKYLKKVWFANGIHHHYSGDKFTPEFSEDFFDALVAGTPAEKFPKDCDDIKEAMVLVKKIIFDPALYAKRVNQTEGQDMLLTSACNYYEGVTQREAEAFYAKMTNPKDPNPISYGLNSKLVKEGDVIKERVWKLGGMYSKAIENIVSWLEKTLETANPRQKETIESLISFYRSGDLREFDRFNVLWVQDNESMVDFVDCFTETYGDPLGYKASWESLINFKDVEATRRTSILSSQAQWFEDNSPIDAKYKKGEVKGVSAKVINAAILGGDCYPATPIGINLPNADWIRRDHGSKSVTIQNITQAYFESSKGNGFLEEFMLRPEDRKRIETYGLLADNLHTDMHECLGHGSGQLAPGVKGDELKNYYSALEETRADLFGLYYMADPKMIELGLIPSEELYKAEYAKYVMNGLMTQLTRIEYGKSVEQAHMRNRQLIASWCYEHGRADNVIEMVKKDGRIYVVVNDFTKLRELFGKLLGEVQRIKSEGDYNAGKNLVETYGVQVDPALHKEVLDRYAKLHLEPYSGFVNPVYTPVMEGGKIIDIKIEYPGNYVEQMMHYSKEFSFLPTIN